LENESDKLLHGTTNTGERNGHAKLTMEDVRRIRLLSGKISQDALGEIFGVSQSSISLIVLGKIWKDSGDMTAGSM